MVAINKFKRFFRHIFSSKKNVFLLFGARMGEIEQKIKECESQHAGEICLFIDPGLSFEELLSGKTAKDKAREIFTKHHIWDTEGRNGVLIYLLLADREFEIVADRNICKLVRQEKWQEICQQMEKNFFDGKFVDGLLNGIEQISQVHKEATSGCCKTDNVLPDKPQVL